MPDNTPKRKIEQVTAFGPDITLCEPTAEAREATARKVTDDTGGVLIHPYENPFVVLGQGTMGVELLQQHAELVSEGKAELDAILVPVSGGGMSAGVALATWAQHDGHKPKIILVEPLKADDTQHSFKAGKRVEWRGGDTIADGLRAWVGEMNFDILKEHALDIVRVSESEIVDGMDIAYHKLRQVVEPSGAVCIGALLSEEFMELDKIHRFNNIALVLSGGNFDVTTYNDIIKSVKNNQ